MKIAEVPSARRGEGCYCHLRREYMNAEVNAEDAGAILSRGVRNDKFQRCILTSGTAHHKPENIMLRDLQFG